MLLHSLKKALLNKVDKNLTKNINIMAKITIFVIEMALL